jgi:hypothetical protein
LRGDERVSLTLHLEPRATYLYAGVAGTFELPQMQGTLQRVLDACARHGLGKVLIDARAVGGQMSVSERYEWGTFHAQVHLAYLAAGHHALRIAYLAREPLLDPERLGEAVAQNRGVDARAFTDPAAAAAWLGIDAEITP